jgi:hypothetical protein
VVAWLALTGVVVCIAVLVWPSRGHAPPPRVATQLPIAVAGTVVVEGGPPPPPGGSDLQPCGRQVLVVTGTTRPPANA